MSKKNKKLLDKLYKLICGLLIAIMLVSGFSAARIIYKYMKARNVYKATESIAMATGIFDGNIDFDALAKINPDIQGWLYQEDSVINYPVVQGEDNDKYLHTLFDGTWNGGGTLFVDCNNAKNFKDFNSIIYGHHMRDGSMFHCLRGYTKEAGYYDGHKTFDLITPDGWYQLIVVSAYITPATSDAYTIKFADDTDKQKFIDMTMNKSLIDTGETVTTDDRLVTLSTCAYDYDDARYVVVTKMVPINKKKK